MNITNNTSCNTKASQLLSTHHELTCLLSKSTLPEEDITKIQEVYIRYLEDQVSKLEDNNNLAFPIRDFIDEFNIVIKEDDLPSKISGKLENRQITVNCNNIPARKNFTIAHEFAHFALGDTNDTKYRSNIIYNTNDNQKERLCDKISACILMHKDVVRKRLDIILRVANLTNIRKNPFLIHNLADDFKVSPNAMITRLRNLGIITGWVNI